MYTLLHLSVAPIYTAWFAVAPTVSLLVFEHRGRADHRSQQSKAILGAGGSGMECRGPRRSAGHGMLPPANVSSDVLVSPLLRMLL